MNKFKFYIVRQIPSQYQSGEAVSAVALCTKCLMTVTLPGAFQQSGMPDQKTILMQHVCNQEVIAEPVQH